MISEAQPKMLLFQILLLCFLQKLSCGVKVSEISQWASKVFLEQDQERINEINNEAHNKLDKKQTIEKYFELSTKTLRNYCHIQKRIAGQWTFGTGFHDGEKLICMDGIYKAVQAGNCLVYSFGLADDWDFEVFLAELGCIVKAFDPSKAVKRPSNSYLPNLHYFNLGIGHERDHS